MAHTTTSTTTFSLSKYSRSYSSANSQGNDWQHFTNPVLRLILDVTKTDKPELKSVRLRVVWAIQNGAIVTLNDSSEIILEDLELLAFSSLQTHQDSPVNIPLKAVYRDTTVGIRYLHPLNQSNTTMFRRFQIAFCSEPDTNSFIYSIRSVCPCNTSAVNQRQYLPNTSHSQASNPSHYPQLVGAPTMLVSQTSYSRAPSMVAMDSKSQPVSFRNTAAPGLSVSQPNWSTMAPPPPPAQQIIPTPPTCHQDMTSSQPSSSQTYMPSSSQTSSHTTPYNAGPSLENGPSSRDRPVHSHPIINSLKEATSIYDMPLEVLERAVGDVIREDGFASLLERLDQLWKVKGLINCRK